VAAKSSSYYNLTPASSTTSLNDLSLFHTNNNNDIKLNKKKASQTSTVNLVRTSSKKRTRTTTIEQKQQQQQTEEIDSKKNTTTSEQIAVNAATTSRRRGRPPKNNLIKSQIEPSPLLETPVAATLVQPNKVTEQIEVKVADIPQQPAKHDTTHLHHHHSFHRTHSSSNKLIKSSNSNLQKSKIAAEVVVVVAAAVESIKDSGILTNKSNTNNVNTKPQPQITDYLVDQQQLKKQQQQQENLSDIENHQIKTPIKSNNKQTLINDDSFQTPDHNLTPQTPMPKLSWANNNELWQVMRRKEVKYSHDPNYLKRHLNIESQMRAILLDWLVEISYAYRLHRETWYLAVEYMDRFLTCSKQQMRIDRLQLIGMSSLFLAAKVEEIYPPKLKELASHMETYSTNNEDAISQFELFMLKTLNWEISPVTANTWLMTYLQIASINYYSIVNSNSSNNNVLSTNMVMPLSIYKNNNNLSKLGLNNDVNLTQQEFYLENYMKSVTLLDLCMFDMESLKFSYSILAASAMYHMITLNNNNNNSTASANNNNNNNQNKALFVQTCTGYKLYELDACIKWMYPYADVCKDIITEEKMIEINQFANIESDDCHNIQLYYQNLELLVNTIFFLNKNSKKQT
jgi:G1/S-specific cyclin-E1